MAKSPFMEAMRREMRLRGYSLRTEKTYLSWIKRFILFHGKQHPEKMGVVGVRAFLTHLSANRGVSPNTQKTALNALAFLYNKYLQRPLGDLEFRYASKPAKIPTVLTQQEVKQILSQLQGKNRVIFELLYGSGLRISECLRIRVMDIDLEKFCLTVRSGKGDKDRNTMLSPKISDALKQLIEQAIAIQQEDNKCGIGPSLPFSLGRNTKPTGCALNKVTV